MGTATDGGNKDARTAIQVSVLLPAYSQTFDLVAGNHWKAKLRKIVIVNVHEKINVTLF